MEWSKPKSLPDGTKTESHPAFKIPLHLPDGRQITARVHVTPNTGDIIKGMCRSGGIGFPEGEFILQPDDLERVRFFIQIVHEEFGGAKVAKVRFNQASYIIGLNPALEGITFPNEPPRGGTLQVCPSVVRSSQPASTRDCGISGSAAAGSDATFSV